MRSLTLVFSPFQMLNAIEARHSLHSSGDQCHLVYCRGVSDRNAAQIRMMIDPAEWASVEYLAEPESLKTLRCRATKLEGMWRKRAPFDRLIVGHFGFSLGRHLANTFHPAEVVVLDDGTASHRNFETRFDYVQSAGGKPAAAWKSWPLMRGLKRTLFRADSRPFDSVTHFTIYRHRIHSCDRRIENSYAHWRSQRNSRIDPDVAYFLGGCLVELGIVTEETYLAMIVHAASRLAQSRVIYIPHRRERSDRLGTIATRTGWTVEALDVPVELHLLRSPTIPGTIASLYSTALDSCKLLFGEVGMKIEAHVIPPDKILIDEQRRFIDMVYTYYTTHYTSGFGLIPVEVP
jgi:hypothetical protein